MLPIGLFKAVTTFCLSLIVEARFAPGFDCLTAVSCRDCGGGGREETLVLAVVDVAIPSRCLRSLLPICLAVSVRGGAGIPEEGFELDDDDMLDLRVCSSVGNPIPSKCVLSLSPICLALSVPGTGGLTVLVEDGPDGGGRDVTFVGAASPSMYVLSLFPIVLLASDFGADGPTVAEDLGQFELGGGPLVMVCLLEGARPSGCVRSFSPMALPPSDFKFGTRLTPDES